MCLDVGPEFFKNIPTPKCKRCHAEYEVEDLIRVKQKDCFDKFLCPKCNTGKYLSSFYVEGMMWSSNGPIGIL